MEKIAIQKILNCLSIQNFKPIWVDKVKHCKVCTKVEHDGDCLKGIKMDCKKENHKPCHKEEKECYEKKCEEECFEKKCDDECDKKDDKCDKKPERPCRPPFGRPF